MNSLTDKEFLERCKGMQRIGITEELEYLHPEDRTMYKGQFEFFWNSFTGSIDVCHRGCNGAVFTGRLNEDGSVTFSPRYGYPEASVFEKEFRRLLNEFKTRKERQP